LVQALVAHSDTVSHVLSTSCSRTSPHSRMAGRINALMLFFFGGVVSIAQSRSNFRTSSAELQEGMLRQELTDLLGHGDAAKSERLETLQALLQPMYAALPKKPDGSLDQGVVRYALHRFFVQRHGWHVKGLQATGSEQWGDLPAIVMFEGRVPDDVLDLVRHRFNGVRMGLHDLAVLAATLEDLIHGEAIQKLKAAFVAQRVSVDEVLPVEMEDRIVNTYMLFHVKPHPNFTKMSPSRLNHVLSQASRFLPGWEDTLLWVQDIKHSMEYEQLQEKNPFSGSAEWHTFEAITRVVEQVGEQYGQYQNVECRALKNALLDLEDNERGRVRLSKFYAPTLDGSARHFGESPSYMRHLGALDETDPSNPSVIVTNYLYSKSNCLAASGLYSVCCINQCEALMANLERGVKGPTSSARVITDLISAMPSDTIVAPRNLSSVLRDRLDDVNQRHGGSIPIHGRLFAQWMHHAFPNECPYPYASGSVDAPMTAAEWRVSTGQVSARATKEDMQSYVDAGMSADMVDELATVVPWTEEEELVAPLEVGHASAVPVMLCVRCVVLMMAMGSAAVGILRMARAPSATLPLHSKGKESSSWFPGLARAQKAHFV